MASQANPTETYTSKTKGNHDLPPERSDHSRQVYFRGWMEPNPPGTEALFWSSGCDVAERLSHQDLQSYIDARLVKAETCACPMKDHCAIKVATWAICGFLAHELAFDCWSGFWVRGL
jgi:hypothetical protein